MHLGSLASGGIIVNYRCPAACGHCLYACGPRRETGYLSPTQAGRVFEKVRGLGCRSVHIGGGEPFLDRKGLAGVLDAAAAAAVRVEYVETNAAWCRDVRQAADHLRELRDHGLRTLLISISPFHNAFVPLARTRALIDACGQAGLGVFPWIADFATDLAAFDPDRTHAASEYEERFGPDYIAQAGRRYGVTMGGRALETFGPAMPRRSLADLLAETAGGCHRLADTSHFHVDFLGNYVPTRCTGLTVAVEDLGGELDPARYPILTGLHDKGVAWLLAHGRSACGFTPRASGYACACDLCADIRCRLFAAGVGGRELGPAGFYGSLRPAQSGG